MKVARTVSRGGKSREVPTYPNRPYAALLVMAGRHMNLGQYVRPDYNKIMRICGSEA